MSIGAAPHFLLVIIPSSIATILLPHFPDLALHQRKNFYGALLVDAGNTMLGPVRSVNESPAPPHSQLERATGSAEVAV